MSCISIGILGNGTVGSGVVELIAKNKDYIKRRTGLEVYISKILVKDISKHVDKKYCELITEDINAFLSSDTDIVVEAMGGLHPAYDYIKQFLQLKKHVVTANKDVVARYGEELSKLAEENGVSLRFEASVAGGIPILKPLQECLAGNDILSIIAILNGTTNFILSKMYNEGMEYECALKDAQALGFAEANPDADVFGYDTARKLAILSTISYDERLDWEDINIEGIINVNKTDIECAKALECTVKLLAISSKAQNRIYASVRPVLISKEQTLSKVENEFNGILLEGDAVGNMFFCGKGAGKLPTASAVMGDIFDVLENKKQKSMFMVSKKADLLTKWPKKSKWLLQVTSTNTNNSSIVLNSFFNSCEILNRHSENLVSAVVEAENETILDDFISSMQESSEVLSIRKIQILDL